MAKTSGFSLTASIDLNNLHDFSELPQVEATLDEIAMRNSTGSVMPDLAVSSLNADRIWADYNKGKPTAVQPKMTRAEVERRIRGGK